jgi:hypothetical protein
MQDLKNEDELFDDIERFHEQLVLSSAELPPIHAKGLIEKLLTAAVPLMAEMRLRYPEVVVAIDTERANIAHQIEVVKQNTAKVEQTFASLLPPEEVLKQMIPVAPPVGLMAVTQFTDELFNRYVVTPTDEIAEDEQGNAWQDWAIDS